MLGLRARTTPPASPHDLTARAFAALDELTRLRLDEQLYNLWRQTGTTVLFVTHSIAEAVFLAQRVVMFTRRPARVLTDQRIDLPIERPAEIRTELAFNQIVRGLQHLLHREEP